MKKLLKMLVLAMIIIITSCNTNSDEIILDDPSAVEIENFEGTFEAKNFEALEKHGRYFAFSRADVINPILGIATGKSKLIRGRRGIYTRYRSNNLIPGHAYTLWWVIWNNPEECLTPNGCGDPDDVDFLNPATEVDVLFAGSGRVIGNNGKGTFYGLLRAGDDSDSVNDLMGIPLVGGLQTGNTFGAEVHLVLRSHGPAIPGMIYEQISGYTGGCTDPFAILPFTEIPDEVGECGDIEFSIHAPVN